MCQYQRARAAAGRRSSFSGGGRSLDGGAAGPLAALRLIAAPAAETVGPFKFNSVVTGGFRVRPGLTEC